MDKDDLEGEKMFPPDKGTMDTKQFQTVVQQEQERQWESFSKGTSVV